MFTSYLEAIQYLKSIDKLWLISDEMEVTEVIEFADACVKKIDELNRSKQS